MPDLSPLSPINMRTELEKLVPKSAKVVTFRIYSGGWPVRGTVPAGGMVIWIKFNPSDPNPTVGGSYMVEGVDVALLAQA
jgi:hypothetical protein